MIHLPELPRILPRQITRLFRRIVATMRAPHHWGCSRLGLIMAAAFTVGCTEASSPRADDPIVVDVVWGDGRKTRMELSSQEALAEQQGRPVAFLLVEDGEIVQEFVKARFARSRPEAGPVSLQDIDESPVLQLVNEMMSAVPSYSELDQLHGEDLARVSRVLEQLSAEAQVCLERLTEMADSLKAAPSRGS